MSPEIGRAAFMIGAFIGGTALVLLPFQARDSAEFVVTVLSLIVGGILMLLVAILARLTSR